MPLGPMVSATPDSAELKTSDGLRYFDAQAWAFVHYLMFADGGAHAPKLNQFVNLLKQGQARDTAFGSTIGEVAAYESAFATYVNRSLYSAVQVKVDMELDRERIPARPMTVGETALARASFHVAMRRPTEARALLDAAVKADPTSPGPSTVEAIMLDTGKNPDEAKAAYGRAVELGTTDAHALYRFAMLHWRGADASMLETIEKSLAKAVEMRPLLAAAHASLAEVRAELRRPQLSIASHMHRAIALEPSNPWHRIAAARVLGRLNAIAEAREAAESALKMADGDSTARAEAERVLAMLKGR
jgi:tetratricopeptide (TPR) repeat protein